MAALTFPSDLILIGAFWRRSFRLSYRQELSRVAGGTTIRRNLGRPLWRAEYSTKSLRPNQLSEMRADVDALDGGIFTFRGYDPARCRPIAYPSKGTWFPGFSGVGRVAQIYPDNKRLDIDTLPAGYIVSKGDLIEVGEGRLYSVVRGAIAGAGGVASDVEIRPWFYPGTAVGNFVKLLQPYCPMAINPDELGEDTDTSTGRGVYSFTAWEVPNA